MFNLKNVFNLITSRLTKEDHKMQRLFEFVDFFKKEGLAPKFYSIETAGTEPEVMIGGKKYLMFCSNNYLGLSTMQEIIQETEKALKKHGLGPGGARFLCGNIDILEELDQETAKLVETEDAITFPTGYMANLAIFKALMDPIMGFLPYRKGEGTIFSDEFNHGTIIDGCRLSYAKKVIFRHNNLEDLERKISRISTKQPSMIVTEGVFTPWGEVSPIPEILKIAKKYNAILMVDDAHGVGVLGNQGGGTIQHFGLQGQIDVIMGSFDKALGGMGGFLAGNKNLIEYLRIVSRPYLFSSAISGVLAGGLIKAIQICKARQDLREKLFDNANYITENLEKLGFKILGNKKTPVAPLFIGDENKAIKFSEILFERGVFCPSFRWPAVPKGTSRLRLTIMATHTHEHLDTLLNTIEKTGRELKIIP